VIIGHPRRDHEFVIIEPAIILYLIYPLNKHSVQFLQKAYLGWNSRISSKLVSFMLKLYYGKVRSLKLGLRWGNDNRPYIVYDVRGRVHRTSEVWSCN